MIWLEFVERGWLIVGMNHYIIAGKRHLFVAMSKGNQYIKAEGIDSISIWQKLKIAEESITNILISNGELVDKITILEIKQELIQDKNKLVNIIKELKLLQKVYNDSINNSQISKLKRDLYRINKNLWFLEDSIRQIYVTDDINEMYIKARLSFKIHTANDCRAEIKKQINTITKSYIIEEKSY